jgi:hypothetical protein
MAQLRPVQAPYRSFNDTIKEIVEKQIFKQKPSVGTKVVILKGVNVVPHTTLPKLSF